MRSAVISHLENDTQAFETYLMFAHKISKSPNELAKLHLMNKNTMKKFKSILLEDPEKHLTEQNQNILQFLAIYFILKVENPEKKINDLVNYCNLLDDFTLKCVVNIHYKQLQDKNSNAKNSTMQKLCFVYPQFLPFLDSVQ